TGAAGVAATEDGGLADVDEEAPGAASPLPQPERLSVPARTASKAMTRNGDGPAWSVTGPC
ncbi:hypothetical protein ACFY1C_35240, partial [Streptomyces sp. NPDC001279]|uniref:hypothetical protein n=1 Tax=Streptomyces sp. NPDC001279 TaxID=3364556 RepID=UPI0036C377CB